ncbi:hypothetical protein HKX48_008111 [Thoreauomyces humboldtii]|nr:hypothetical protein HKX48_008111 [Thoreauomyces humboldtii]
MAETSLAGPPAPSLQGEATSPSSAKSFKGAPKKTKKKGCGVCGEFAAIRRKPVDKNPELARASAAISGAAVAAAVAASASSAAVPSAPFPCPPDSSNLGSSTWTFLHTMAAYYPTTPSPAEQLSMRNFVSALTRFYPCGFCADHLTQEVVRRPPDVTSNRALSKWFCEVHNEVNERQGKPIFDCSKVFERWRDGEKDRQEECWGGDLGEH